MFSCTYRVLIPHTEDPFEFEDCAKPAVAVCKNIDQYYCRKHYAAHLDQKWPEDWYHHIELIQS